MDPPPQSVSTPNTGDVRPAKWVGDLIQALGNPALLTALGLILYGMLRLDYGLFYARFNLAPEEVGLGYLQILAQSAVGTILLMIAVLLLAILFYLFNFVLPFGLIRFVLRILEKTGTRLKLTAAFWPFTAVVSIENKALQQAVAALLPKGSGEVSYPVRGIILGRVGRFFAAIAIIGTLGFLPFAAVHSADAALRGVGEGRVSFLGIPILGTSAIPAKVMWVGPGAPPLVNYSADCLMYLGQSDGTDFVYDASKGNTLQLPAADALVLLSDRTSRVPCLVKGQGAPPQSQSPPPTVKNVTETVSPTTRMYNLAVDIRVVNVICPASATLRVGPRTESVPVCANSGSPPSNVHALVPVFDPADPYLDLIPSDVVGVSAQVGGGSVYSGLIRVPSAPVWVGVGDSYSSGHHQVRDKPWCVVVPLRRCGVHRNSPDYSWVWHATEDVNSRLRVPAAWKMQSLILAKSGAKAAEFISDGQVSKMATALHQHSGSWDVVSLTGGANDAQFSKTLAWWYSKHLGQRPWAVDGWTSKACPNSDALLRRAMMHGSAILKALHGVLTTAQSASASTRFVDVTYPYIVANGNHCGEDQLLPSGLVWRGSKAVVNYLDGLISKLHALGLWTVDLRTLFDTSSKLADLQLIRLYGYPHPNASGQALTAAAAARAVVSDRA